MYPYIDIQWWIFSSIQNPHPPQKKKHTHTHPSRDSSSVFFTHPDDLRLGSDIGLGISPLAHQHHSQARFRSSAFFKALDSTFQLLGTVGTWIVEIRGEKPTVCLDLLQNPGRFNGDKLLPFKLKLVSLHRISGNYGKMKRSSFLRGTTTKMC